ncbi:MAG: hypothetical protein V4607_02100 [Pseudomonadota bacterium]
MTDKKPVTDWELAERLYRAGQLSNVQIAAQINVSEGALRKRAKKDGWTKDLTAKVQEATRAKLVRDEVRAAHATRTERDVVEQAAESAVAVVRLHRKDLSSGQQLIGLLFTQLKDAAENRHGDLDEVAQEEAKKDGLFAGSTLARFRKAMSLPTHAGVIRDLSTAMKNFQGLERTAWNLDDKDDTPPDYEAELKRLALSK